MKLINQTIEKIRADFISGQKVLQAVGDETRQNIMLALMETSCRVGMRVGEITSKTHLSRPAVSHHLKILKEAGIVTMHKEGTMNFYAIDIHGGLLDLIQLSDHIKDYADKIALDEKR